jgi:hypothetical protein
VATGEAGDMAGRTPAFPRLPTLSIRTAIILVADGEPVPHPSNSRRFLQPNNLRLWDGPRMSEHQRCGGGRRVVRKGDPDS